MMDNMASSPDPMAQAYGVYVVLSQEGPEFHWRGPQDTDCVLVSEMTESRRINLYRWLIRRANYFGALYPIGFWHWMSVPRYREVINEEGGEPVFGQQLTELDLIGENAMDALERSIQEVVDQVIDPIAWLRDRPLLRAIADGIEQDLLLAGTAAEYAELVDEETLTW